MDEALSPAAKPLYRGTQIIWYLLGLVEVILALRFLLKILGANPLAGFSYFIYNLSQPLVQPFVNVFGTARVATASFESATLLAMIVYWLIAWGLVGLLVMSRPVTTPEAHHNLREQ
jgi:hypothetical protein